MPTTLLYCHKDNGKAYYKLRTLVNNIKIAEAPDGVCRVWKAVFFNFVWTSSVISCTTQMAGHSILYANRIWHSAVCGCPVDDVCMAGCWIHSADADNSEWPEWPPTFSTGTHSSCKFRYLQAMPWIYVHHKDGSLETDLLLYWKPVQTSQYHTAWCAMIKVRQNAPERHSVTSNFSTLYTLLYMHGPVWQLSRQTNMGER